MSRVRLLPFGVYDPHYNMALDTVLLARAGAGRCPPTFRLYGWSKPTLSLGRSQRLSVLGIQEIPDAYAIVQRPTGGAVAVHGRDISYCLATPYPVPFLPPRPRTCFRVIHEVIVQALRKLGCSVETVPDEVKPDYRAKVYCGLSLSPCDITGGGRKLVGSAQRLAGGGLLQHGFILVDEDFSWVRQLLGNKGEAIAASSVTLEELLGKALPDGETLRATLLEALRTLLNVELDEAPLGAEEEQAVSEQSRVVLDS